MMEFTNDRNIHLMFNLQEIIDDLCLQEHLDVNTYLKDQPSM